MTADRPLAGTALKSLRAIRSALADMRSMQLRDLDVLRQRLGSLDAQLVAEQVGADDLTADDRRALAEYEFRQSFGPAELAAIDDAPNVVPIHAIRGALPFGD